MFPVAGSWFIGCEARIVKVDKLVTRVWVFSPLVLTLYMPFVWPSVRLSVLSANFLLLFIFRTHRAERFPGGSRDSPLGFEG